MNRNCTFAIVGTLNARPNDDDFLSLIFHLLTCLVFVSCKQLLMNESCFCYNLNIPRNFAVMIL